MTRPSASSPRAVRRRTGPRTRGQRGFTLIEVMLTVVLGAMIAIPLGAWMILGYETHDTLTKRSHDDGAAVFVTTWFQRDVATASSAFTVGPACPPMEGSASTAPPEVILTLVYSDFGSGSTRAVYAVAEDTGNDGVVRGTLLRRRCTNAPDSVTTAEVRLMDRVERPASGWSGLVRCDERQGFGAADPCGGVTLSLTGPSEVPMSVSAVLRTGLPR